MVARTRDVVFAVPGDLNTVTGGYAYDRAVIAHLPGHGWRPQPISLGPGFPHPTEATIAGAVAALNAVPDDQPIIIDGLAYGVLPAAALARLPNPIMALVHHPLALETGLRQHDAARLAQTEKAALAEADAIMVTSPHTGRVLADQFAVPANKISVATPGIPHSSQARERAPDPPVILSVGTITRRKGVHLLLNALASVKDRPWQAVICGGREHDPAYAAEVDVVLADHKLASRVTFTGSVTPEELARRYAISSFFVLASHYEGYGMAFAEAIRHGLPVVGFDVGAVPDTVGEAGVLVPDGDQAALNAAIARLLDDRDWFATMTARAARQGARYPDWSDTAGRFAQALDQLVATYQVEKQDG